MVLRGAPEWAVPLTKSLEQFGPKTSINIRVMTPYYGPAAIVIGGIVIKRQSPCREEVVLDGRVKNTSDLTREINVYFPCPAVTHYSVLACHYCHLSLSSNCGHDKTIIITPKYM